MKALIIILLSLSVYNVNAQKDINFMKKMTRAKNSLICFQCGNIQSKVVIEITKLIQGTKYTEIKKLLQSENSREKFLAAVTCDKLFTLKKISLSDIEKKRIEEIYNSKDILYAYSNDTYAEAKSIKDYIYNKEDRLLWKQTQRWLDSILK